MPGTPPLAGTELPRLASPPPGPASRALARRLAGVESRNITRVEPDPPIFWVEARGANVRDADGNVYVDLTAGFGVAAAGHANERVAAAVAAQAARLPHGLGDVYPPEPKLRLLERLAELAPDPLGVSILAGSGAEAVEAALKTAVLRTGRPGVLAFEGGYHGLTYGALAATSRREFRAPFHAQLFGGVAFAPFPTADAEAGPALEAVRRALEDADAPHPVGAVLVEPVQGRGGLRVPPPGFLRGLRDLCDGERTVLIFDEVYTGFGRTGRWFAAEHSDVVPDIMTVGKALGGGLPISAAIGSARVMRAWPVSTGEAIHTSTFLGNPVACAAALAQLDEIERLGLVERAERLGEVLAERLEKWVARYPLAAEARGLGLMRGVALTDPVSGDAATETALGVVERALRRGVILLAEGPEANVLAFTPPLVITEEQLEFCLGVVEEEIRRVDG